MKTGTVAKRFDLDPKTVTGWTDMFAEFFTSSAKGEGQTQRDYQPEDLWAINTIKIERSKNAPFEQIRARLASHDFDTNLPPEFTTIEGDSAITVYAEMREMRVKLENAEAEIERLYRVIEDDRKQAEDKLQDERKRSDVERETYQARIEKLIEEKTEWRMLYQNLKKRVGRTDDNDE